MIKNPNNHGGNRDLSKTKKGFAVLLETWTPERKTRKLEPTNYPTYNLTQHMTYEQAKVVAKRLLV